MIPNLTHEEETVLRHLVTHGRRERQIRHILANLLLLFGGILLIGTIVYLLQHATDTTVFLVAVPGILVGLLLVVLYVSLSKKEQQERRMSTILTKLLG